MAVVFRAHQASLSRDVALKLLRKREDEEAEANSRFFREMRTMAHLRHPRLVQILDGGVLEDTPFLAMELVRGKTLQSTVLESGPIPWRESLEMLAQIGEALAYIHENRVLHRDLSPANVFIVDGDIKVADFGLARVDGATLLTMPDVVLGTPPVLAPELLEGKDYSCASDLWSAGCLFYFMLVGRLPIEPTKNMARLITEILESTIRPPASLVAGIPSSVSDLTMAMLERDPRRRLARADQLVTICRAHVRPPGPRVQRSGTRGVILSAALGLVVVASLWPRRHTGERDMPAVVVATPAPANRYPLMAVWHEHEDLLGELARAPADKRLAVMRKLQHVVPVAIGLSPEDWLWWRALGEWLEGAHAGGPPRLSRAVRGMFPIYERVTFLKGLDPYPDKTRPTRDIVSKSFYWVMMYPDDPFCWLTLGRMLEYDGLPGPAQKAYHWGLSLEPTARREIPQFLANTLAELLVAGIGGTNLERDWPKWIPVGGDGMRHLLGVRRVLSTLDPERYRRFLDELARHPGEDGMARHFQKMK